MKKGFKFQLDIDRYELKVDRITDPQGCHPWLAAKKPSGYGKFSLGHARWVYAHRWGYEYYIGPIPSGLVIRHSCDNPSCVNPKHLLLGTHADNVQDKISKNRIPKGEGASWSKLNEQDVLEIRTNYKKQTDSSRELAAKYSVNRRTILHIINHDIWK